MEQPPENKVDSHNEEEVPPEQHVPPPGLVTEDSVPPWLRKVNYHLFPKTFMVHTCYFFLFSKLSLM